jgi:hypothetical protein
MYDTNEFDTKRAWVQMASTDPPSSPRCERTLAAPAQLLALGSATGQQPMQTGYPSGPC